MIDLVLIGVAAAWCAPLVVLVVLVVVLRRAVRKPLTDMDRRLSAVDEDMRRREYQERAAAARLRGERRVVCELQPERGRARRE